MTARPSTDDVRAELTGELVIHEYGLRAQRRGSQYRLKECPRCHERSKREAIAVDAKTGRWIHHGHERAAGGNCSGDVLDLVAACEGLDCRRDFGRVMERATAIAGIVAMSDADRAVRVALNAERSRAAAAEAISDWDRAKEVASFTWNDLATRCDRGTAYLAGRGIDLFALCGAARFTDDGVAVAIRDSDGSPVNIARRLYKPGTAKVMTMKDHSTHGTMVDAVADICGERMIVVTEGVIDSLTARLAWPHAVVLGANGAGNVPKVVEAAIARAKLAGAALWLAPHDDDAGHRSAIRAGRIAQAAGVEPQFVDYETKDLNDAWCAGWRP